MRPSRIKILGKPFTVEERKAGHPDLLDEKGNALAGSVFYEQQRISIQEGMALESDQDTLFHEYIHALEEAMDIGLRETQVKKLATGMLADLKANPKLVAYLRRKTNGRTQSDGPTNPRGVA
jgi:hypothetical protein